RLVLPTDDPLAPEPTVEPPVKRWHLRFLGRLVFPFERALNVRALRIDRRALRVERRRSEDALGRAVGKHHHRPIHHLPLSFRRLTGMISLPFPVQRWLAPATLPRAWAPA